MTTTTATETIREHASEYHLDEHASGLLSQMNVPNDLTEDEFDACNDEWGESLHKLAAAVEGKLWDTSAPSVGPHSTTYGVIVVCDVTDDIRSALV
jgi:hypothetical protein